MWGQRGRGDTRGVMGLWVMGLCVIGLWAMGYGAVCYRAMGSGLWALGYGVLGYGAVCYRAMGSGLWGSGLWGSGLWGSGCGAALSSPSHLRAGGGVPLFGAFVPRAPLGGGENPQIRPRPPRGAQRAAMPTAAAGQCQGGLLQLHGCVNRVSCSCRAVPASIAGQCQWGQLQLQGSANRANICCRAVPIGSVAAAGQHQ